MTMPNTACLVCSIYRHHERGKKIASLGQSMRVSKFWPLAFGIIAKFDGVCIYTNRLLNDKCYSKEHVVTASSIRKNCDITTRALALVDGHNLWPAERDVNCARSNYTLVNHWGNCPDEDTWCVNTKAKVFAPPRSARGALARTALYMQGRYDVDVSQSIDFSAMRSWREMSLTSHEMLHHQHVFKFQGTVNPFVVHAAAAANLMIGRGRPVRWPTRPCRRRTE